MKGKKFEILDLIFVALALISCGGGGGGGGSTAPATGSNSIIGSWISTNTASNGTVITAELTFDNSNYRHIHKENGTVTSDMLIPYTLSGNTIVFNRGNAVVNFPSGVGSLPSATCSYTYILNGNTLTITEFFIDGAKQPTIFGMYNSVNFTRK
ncbi:MAG: hypothetical protein IKK38_02530 [Spirochaetaceae bacterium]|nr:hypothetical protein [Spirochaetaceae bacterium]